ncbi:MAG: CDGSH iron-sulfur domain-containing protein [Candidatus Eremiobacteraeota bacterium]|nr:CDGSH iron-sulfur domain-containing protein [Candidatus Eremiobacteraeota bacterium]
MSRLLERPRRTKRVSPVNTREELLYLLTRASELEHSLACVYLYAGYSLKSDLREGGLTEAETATVRTWKRKLAGVAVEEMLHFGQVCNLMTAVGGAPHFARSNFPLPASAFPFGINIALEPFSQALIERFVCYEMPERGVLPKERVGQYEAIRKRAAADIDRSEYVRLQNTIEPFDVDFQTVGEFYHKVESAFHAIPTERLFIGDPAAQASPTYLDFPKELVQVTDVASACRAIDMIIEQGEAPTAEHPDAHFVVFDSIRQEYESLVQRARDEGRVFDPVRPLLTNPTTRGIAQIPNTNRITDPLGQELAALFNSAYAVMLMMLARFFAHGEESDEEMRLLARGTLRIMASGLRPLGEALAKTPAGPEYPGKHAGPTFGFMSGVHLLSHKKAAWIFFLERLYDLSTRLTKLSEQPNVPEEIQEAAAALESVAEHLSPFIPKAFVAAIRSDAEARSTQTTIRPELNGPYIVRNLRKLTNSKGDSLAVRPVVALCRCGGSQLKPYCDGTHARIGFVSAKDPNRVPDRLDRYDAADITVLDNRGTCCHFGNCTDHLPAVFHSKGEPFVTADGASADAIEEIVRQCPSGALGFIRDGAPYEGEKREGEIYVAHNASYYVRGGIELEGEPMNAGASREHYALCRCGHSKNKPFCDGTHWWIKFNDDDN